VNTTKFAKILAIKKKAEYDTVTCRCEKKLKTQRGDVFEKYKHNLVGVKEQLN
jgi:hypothetical protein